MDRTSKTVPALRWRIAVMVSAAIAISYLDRQTLPVAIKAIQQDIPISNERFSFLNTAFLVAYGLMYAGGGKLLDLLGTRLGFTVVMAFWSLACASHGLAANLAMLAASRLLLGMGEGGGFPAATRSMAEWFPERERSTAMGIMNAGTALGAVAAPPLIALVLSFANWRWVFFITGALGLAWTVWWRRDYFLPANHPKLGDAERQQLRSVIQASQAAPAGLKWSQLFRYRQTWGLVIAKTLSDAAWYFYLFWLPKYLYDARGFDIKAVGTFAWIPYAAAGIGCLCGGWFSSLLLQRHFSLNTARKLALGVSAAMMPFILFVPHVPAAGAIALFSLAYFGQQSWSTLIMTLPADIFEKASVGSVAGLVGFGGAMGGVVFGQLVGYLLDHGSGYGLVFALAGSFHILAFLALCLIIPAIGPLHFNPESIDEDQRDSDTSRRVAR
ncbi:MAG TPA: MFS transporter [Candidatus Binatia bacterium]|jgi:ACS family hexuronate transporter-like MFS transporter|nr:MFS transporter [Candidatus Binatia bacterium]